MNSPRSCKLVGMVVLILGLLCVPLSARSQQQDSQQKPPAQSTANPSPQNQPPINQIFVGKLVMSEGNVVLVDQTVLANQESRTKYHLENEDQAIPFVGRNVVVTGTLDQTTNTLHIISIR